MYLEQFVKILDDAQNAPAKGLEATTILKTLGVWLALLIFLLVFFWH
jgi:hypothetical protein